ncbi:sensor histidine kinase [Eubacterium oxidoreducens]|uniref:Histidine kinase n=1 Tax=Eubacterium oxidoreducens TaxID=1732 RepID=A0A1G6AGU9_EUBOX|nr:histidine kinase [Eubacterium oxidoreducens]SDB07652.1 Histidine kinase [Eubacterium oxidoreducens]
MLSQVLRSVEFYVGIEVWASILCFAAALYRLVGRLPKDGRTKMCLLLFVTGIMMLGDVFAWGYNGISGQFARHVIIVGNFLCYFGPYLVCYIYGWYMRDFTSRRKVTEVIKGILYLDTFYGMITSVISLFNGMYYYVDDANRYVRGPLFLLSQNIGVVFFILVVIILIIERKYMGWTMFFIFFCYVGYPTAAVVFSVFRQMPYSQLNLGISMAVLTMFVFMMHMQRVLLDKQSAEIIMQQKEINELQIGIVMSQIQPHFMFNCLNSIYYLCEKDSHKAQRAIDNFAKYLRGNMDSMKNTEAITFQQELDHVKTYLELEKMRFEEELKVEYDLQVESFFIPPLTLQPMVENAVKHGVGKKIGGGTVSIHTYETEHEYVVCVKDDGVGFECNEKKNDGRTHIGIENVRQRLKEMVDGRLIIESEVGKGTKSMIIIPK